MRDESTDLERELLALQPLALPPAVSAAVACELKKTPLPFADRCLLYTMMLGGIAAAVIVTMGLALTDRSHAMSLRMQTNQSPPLMNDQFEEMMLLDVLSRPPPPAFAHVPSLRSPTFPENNPQESR